MSDESSADICVDELDAEINVEEVTRAINSLKSGKSSGSDGLIGEIFSSCADILSPIIVKLFNVIFETGTYPQEWTKGIITPIPKKKNPNGVNDYRGITLMGVFGKLFSFILNKRLMNWAETHETLDDGQFGFRLIRSTYDCIYILTSIITKLLGHGKQKKCIYRFSKGH
jgi:hypothetical protein